MERMSPDINTTIEHFWAAKVNRGKIKSELILLLGMLALIIFLNFSKLNKDGNFTFMLFLLGPAVIYYVLHRSYLLRSPLVIDNLVTLRKEDISNQYFRIDWKLIEKIEYQLIKRWGYRYVYYEPFLLLLLKNKRASEYLQNIPYLVRWEFFRLSSVKDPMTMAINLKLISRDPYTIFQVAQKFHGSFDVHTAYQ